MILKKHIKTMSNGKPQFIYLGKWDFEMDGVNELLLLYFYDYSFLTVGECYINLIFKEVEDIQISNPYLPLLFILIIEIGRRMLRKIKKRSFHFVQVR